MSIRRAEFVCAAPVKPTHVLVGFSFVFLSLFVVVCEALEAGKYPLLVHAFSLTHYLVNLYIRGKGLVC